MRTVLLHPLLREKLFTRLARRVSAARAPEQHLRARRPNLTLRKRHEVAGGDVSERTDEDGVVVERLGSLDAGQAKLRIEFRSELGQAGGRISRGRPLWLLQDTLGRVQRASL